MSARTCESLARAAALLIAIALDRQSPDALEDDLLGPSEADAAPAPARAPLPVSPTPPAPPAFVAHARSSPRRLVLLSSGVLGERAVLPRLAFGAYLAGGVEGSALGARLQVASVPRGSVSLPAWPQVGIDFSLVRAELAGCWHGSVGPVVAASCAGLQVSSVRAIATGVDRSTPREATLMAVAPSLLLRWPRRTVVALETAFEVSAPLSRPTFSVHNLGPIYRVHPSGYSGRLGVLLRLGGRDERVAPLTPR